MPVKGRARHFFDSFWRYPVSPWLPGSTNIVPKQENSLTSQNSRSRRARDLVTIRRYSTTGGELSPYVRRNADLTALNLIFAAKLLRDNPYPINIAEHNKVMMERNEVKMEAMKQAVEYMRENMPS